jgi:hypothetical protein
MEKRIPGFFLFAIVLLTISSIGLTLALLPIWHCPICDGETWDKAYPEWIGSVNVVRGETATCVRCNHTGRMNIFQKVKVIRELREVRLDRIPLFH